MKKFFYILMVFPSVLCSQSYILGKSGNISVSDGKAYKGLSLDSCKVLAIMHNYKIKKAANELLQSEYVKKSVFTGYFPKVSAGFTTVKMSDYLVKSSIPQMNLPVYDGNPANLPVATQFAYFPAIPFNMIDYMNIGYAMAAQPVFTGCRIFNGNKLAKTGYDIGIEKESLTSTEVLVKTEELYWNIIALNEKLITVDSYRKLLENLNHDVTVALEVGLVQRIDLLKVQLRQNELEVNRLKLTDGIELNKKALCQHIGITYDSAIVLTDTISIIREPETLYINPEVAVRNRSEYKILEKALQAEELQKKIVLGEYLPQVAVGAAVIYTDFMDKTDQIGMAFATISVPISDWWGGSNKIRQGRAKVENARYQLNETSELLVLQILHEQNEMNQNYFQIEVAQRSLEQSRENLKVTRDNYDSGVTGMSDLLEAQSVLQAALNSLTEAKCNYQISKAKYMQAINIYE